MTKQQMLIAFGKYVAGYRPGEESWTQYDQEALEEATGALKPEQPMLPLDVVLKAVDEGYNEAEDLNSARDDAFSDGYRDALVEYAAIMERRLGELVGKNV